jgi:hypothetical protein
MSTLEVFGGLILALQESILPTRDTKAEASYESVREVQQASAGWGGIFQRWWMWIALLM